MHPAEISKSAARYSLFAFSILFSAVNNNALTPAIIPNIHNVSIKSIIVYSYIYEVADVGLRDYHLYIIVCLIKITYGVRYLHSILFLCCLFRSTALNHHLVCLLFHSLDIDFVILPRYRYFAVCDINFRFIDHISSYELACSLHKFNTGIAQRLKLHFPRLLAT